MVRGDTIETVKILPETSHIGGIREQVAHRRGNRNIGAVAAARRQLELVFYGLRDHHVRALHRSPRGKSPGVVGFRDLGLTVLDLWPGVSLPVLGWAIA